MTASIPDEPTFCFAPIADEDGELPQIRLFVEGLAFAVPTALVCLTAEEGVALADKLNRRLGLDRADWTALAARCLYAAETGSTAIH